MATNFTNFLLSFGEDPKQLEAFVQDAHTILDQAGLTPAEKTLLLSGNIHLIRSALVSDPGLKEAMGIPSHQKLPAKLPTLIWKAPLPEPPPPAPTAGPTKDSDSQG
jgi:hypothetical protein